MKVVPENIFTIERLKQKIDLNVYGQYISKNGQQYGRQWFLDNWNFFHKQFIFKGRKFGEKLNFEINNLPFKKGE